MPVQFGEQLPVAFAQAVNVGESLRVKTDRISRIPFIVAAAGLVLRHCKLSAKHLRNIRAGFSSRYSYKRITAHKRSRDTSSFLPTTLGERSPEQPPAL